MAFAGRVLGLALVSNVLIFVGCGADGPPADESSVTAELSAPARRDRASVIRDVAAARGLSIGPLLAGIGDAETGLAHCWSEATWACQGPYSSSCDGAVIAGSGDGPCYLREGGLGMFQFDGGNFDQTLARDGEQILTLEGNVDHAIDFVIGMVIRSRYVPEAYDADSALAWLSTVPIAPGDGRYEAWISTVTNYYNGCPPTASCWASRRARYESLTRGIFWEMGGDEFWSVEQPPPPPPPPPAPAPEGCGVLAQDQSLERGESISSCSERFVFVHQDDGNVVLYDDGVATWATGTDGIETSTLIMQSDGNLVLYAPNGDPLWASGTYGRDGSWLIVQDDGNVVIYAPEGSALWWTGI